MDLDLGKMWVAIGCAMFGAFAGAIIWGNHAIAVANKAMNSANDEVAAATGALRGAAANSFGAGVHGAVFGGFLGLAIGIAILYFTDPDRGMKIRKVDVDDNY